jgi:hypothetical protein
MGIGENWHRTRSRRASGVDPSTAGRRAEFRSPQARELVIGTKVAPPFAMKEASARHGKRRARSTIRPRGVDDHLGDRIRQFNRSAHVAVHLETSTRAG